MTSETSKSERLMTVAEVSEWLQVSKAWISAHASGNRRPCIKRIKVGKCVRFRRADVEQFIRECEELIAA